MNLNNLNLSPEDLQELKEQLEILVKETKPITREPKVKVLADSINSTGNRLTTFELVFWRPILPQLSRHRVFSLNVRSSRATPVDSLIAEIRNTPWGPKEWGMNQPGMVANKSFGTKEVRDSLDFVWYQSSNLACQMAKTLADVGVHKQIVNRMLEPYACTHAVVSSTEWDNFYELRTASDSQPEMQELANKMKEAQENSTPKALLQGEWHMPYITEQELNKYSVQDCCKISAARCARVSYKRYDGTTNTAKDLELYNKLARAKHFSPLENVATPASNNYIPSNFKGWNQLRKFEE